MNACPVCEYDFLDLPDLFHPIGQTSAWCRCGFMRVSTFDESSMMTAFYGLHHVAVMNPSMDFLARCTKSSYDTSLESHGDLPLWEKVLESGRYSFIEQMVSDASVQLVMGL